MDQTMTRKDTGTYRMQEPASDSDVYKLIVINNNKVTQLLPLPEKQKSLLDKDE
jgi:hypothetical protein